MGISCKTTNSSVSLHLLGESLPENCTLHRKSEFRILLLHEKNILHPVVAHPARVFHGDDAYRPYLHHGKSQDAGYEGSGMC